MRHLITIACFAGALVCYSSQAQPGAALLVLAGAALELVGWARVIKRRRS